MIIKWNRDGYPTAKSLRELKKKVNSENLKEAIEAFYEALKENYIIFESGKKYNCFPGCQTKFKVVFQNYGITITRNKY